MLADPFSPRDGVGNPDGGDFTGFYPVGYVLGVRDNAQMYSQIVCMNFGVVKADSVALQFYSAAGLAERDPVGIEFMGPVAIASLTRGDTDSPDAGAVLDLGIMRIIATDGLRKKNAAIRCTAHVVDRATDTQIADLPVLTLPPKKKKRR